MLAGWGIWGTISKYQKGLPKVTRKAFNIGEVWNPIYYMKVSGIQNGNKLIKTIRYPHMWRYWWFQWYQVCLLNCTKIRWCIFETSSGLLESLRQSSQIFGNSPKMCGNVRLAFGTILENLRKIIKNAVISMFIYVYIIKRTLHVSSKIWILCSSSKNNMSLVRCAHLWDIVLATGT